MPRKSALSTGKSLENRRAAILKAAAQVFLEGGYERACIDDVIAKIGGSKRTIYKEFGNKENLFAEIIKERTAAALAANLPGEKIGETDLRSALVEFGEGFLRLIMAPGTLSLYRVVFGECRQFPMLGKNFYEGGPAQTRAQLARILDHFKKRGEIAVSDTGLAADAFISMIRGNHHMQVLLGLRPPLSPKEIREFVDGKVDIFLNGVAAKR